MISGIIHSHNISGFLSKIHIGLVTKILTFCLLGGLCAMGILTPHITQAAYQCPTGYNLIYDTYSNPQCEIRYSTGTIYTGNYQVVQGDRNSVYGRRGLSVVGANNTNTVIDTSPFFASLSTTNRGRYNNLSVKINPEATFKWLGFSTCLNISSAGEYIVAGAGDDYFELSINGASIDHGPLVNVHYYKMQPIYLSTGTHLINYKYNNNVINTPEGVAGELIGPFATGSLINHDTNTNKSPTEIRDFIYSQGTTNFMEERSGITVSAPRLWTENTIRKTSDEIGRTDNINGDGVGYSCPAGYEISAGANSCDLTCVRVERIPPLSTYYKVNHYVGDADNVFAIQTGDTLIGTGNVGQTITGATLSYTGHTYDSSLSTATGTLLSGEELTLSLYYPIDRFTIDFLTYSGSQVATQTGVAYGSTAAQPTDPTRTGYTFSGWYLSGATDTFDFSTAITGDTTLHARRNIIPIASYTTEHYRQQSDQAYPSTPSVVDTLTGATGSSVTASPKTFAGWTYDPSHTSSITTGTIDATTGLVLKLYYKKDPNVTGPSRPVVGPSKPRLVVEPRPTPTPSKPTSPIPPTSPVSPTLPKEPTLHPAPSADTVVTTTQDTICSFLKQEDTKVGFDYRYDEINFSDQNAKDSRYTKAIQGLLNHCLVQGIGDDHSTYGIEKNLTIAEARKIFVRLSLISYSEYEGTDHRSMRYVSAGDAQNLWQHVLLEYGSTEDAISLGDFMNIASTVIARIKKTIPQIIDNPTLHTRKITRGEAAIVIAHMIEHMYGK